jgi:hypothetical protein
VRETRKNDRKQAGGIEVNTLERMRQGRTNVAGDDMGNQKEIIVDGVRTTWFGPGLRWHVKDKPQEWRRGRYDNDEIQRRNGKGVRLERWHRVKDDL